MAYHLVITCVSLVFETTENKNIVNMRPVFKLSGGWGHFPKLLKYIMRVPLCYVIV